MTSSPLTALPGMETILPAARLRPARFLLYCRDTDHDLCEGQPGHDRDRCTPQVTLDDWRDDHDQALTVVENRSLFDDIGLFDNWTGEWVDEPWWANLYTVTADGPARLDLRPAVTR